MPLRNLRLSALMLLLGSSLACRARDDGPGDDGAGTSGITIIGGESTDGTDGSETTAGASGGSASGLPEGDTDPGWSECFGPYGDNDYETCADACAAEGRVCRANGCDDGDTVKGYVLENCSVASGSSQIGCSDEITLVANAFECCCL